MTVTFGKLVLAISAIASMVLLRVQGSPKAAPESIVAVHSRLMSTLLTGYDKRILPQINDSTAVQLSVGLKLLTLDELYEHEEILETSVYLQLIWSDFRLTWDPSRYQRIHVLHVPVEELWRPDISLFNNADVKMDTMNTLALVFSDGKVYHSPKARIRTRCSMDMTRFPFDHQTCSIKLGSYMYDGNTLNLTMFTAGSEQGTFDLSDYEANKEWQLTSSSVNVVTKVYGCCPDYPYQHMEFNLKLKRNRVYYSHVFILPAVVIAILVPFQFILPPDCRERLTIGSTLLLGIIVLIAMIQNFLPEAHPNLPYLVQYYGLTMIWIALSTVLSAWVINIQSKGPRKRKVPLIVRKLFLKTLKKLVCLTDDNYYPLDDSESVSLRSIEKQSIGTEPNVKIEGNQLEKDVEELLKQVNTLNVRTAIAGSRADVRSEWYQVALVFDRIMCFVFIIIFVTYSCILLN